MQLTGQVAENLTGPEKVLEGVWAHSDIVQLCMVNLVGNAFLAAHPEWNPT